MTAPMDDAIKVIRDPNASEDEWMRALVVLRSSTDSRTLPAPISDAKFSIFVDQLMHVTLFYTMGYFAVMRIIERHLDLPGYLMSSNVPSFVDSSFWNIFPLALSFIAIVAAIKAHKGDNAAYTAMLSSVLLFTLTAGPTCASNPVIALILSLLVSHFVVFSISYLRDFAKVSISRICREGHQR